MKNLLLIIAGIIYMISPLDLIPDVIPLVGWLDDLVVGILTIKKFLEMFSSKPTNSQISCAYTNRANNQLPNNYNNQQNYQQGSPNNKWY